MTINKASILVFGSLLLVFGGVGAVEHSTDNAGLIHGVLVSIVGLVSMFFAVLSLSKD